MRAVAAVLIAILISSIPASAKEREVYFSISTNKTFRPNEKPKVHLYANNVDVMEFRVYRVRDPLAFFKKLEDVHSFGPQYSPRERVDERTALERFHDWKHGWWVAIRDFFRSQYSAESRQEIRERNSEKAKRSRVTASAVFANVPVLNTQQLVARWRVDLPPKYVSESSDLPVENLPAGTYVVEATDGNYRAYTVLLVSQMALVTKSSAGQLLAFTVDRTSGEPTQADVTVWRKEVDAQLKTDKQGLGEAAIGTHRKASGASSSEEEPDRGSYGSEWVLAKRGDDVALVAPYSLNLSSDPAGDWLGYVYTDRPVYRPGHSVQFKGIVRRHNGDALQLPGSKEVEVTVQDPAQNTLLKQKFTLSAFGSFHGKLDIPMTAALGTYWVSAKVEHSTVTGQFDVEEYKKPEYFVKVTPEKMRVIQGDKVNATIEARYYFGEPVANAKVKYVVHTQRAYFFEEEEQDQELPAGDETGGLGQEYFYGEQVLEQEGKLDANGRLQVSIPTKVEEKYKTDVDYRIEARVTDAANREIAGHNGVLATYGSFHLSADTESYVLKQGGKALVTVHAVDYDKHPVKTAVKVELVHRISSDETVLQTVTGETGADGYGKVEVPVTDHGYLMLRATARTPEGRNVQGGTWLWVIGPNETEVSEDGETRSIRIVADKPSYKAGDTAHVVIVGTVVNSTLLVTTEGRTIMSKQIVKGTAENTPVDIPITQEAMPNVQVAAVFVREDQVYAGSKNLSVPPVEQKLNIEITPSKQQFQPGEPATYNVTAKDSKGKPVQAELSLGVVDDAIYAVKPDASGNIVSAFYQRRYSSVSTENSLSFYFHGEAGKKSIQLAGHGVPPPPPPPPGGHDRLAQVKATEFVQPKVRKAFPDTALWVADLRTDANGRATAKLSFPDSLTTWRTTVRAITADTKAGAALNKVLVRKNLMVRMAVPRFFRQGDEVTVSTIVHNYLQTAKTVRMSLDVDGLDLVQGSTQEVNVPQRGETKLDWRVRTKQGATSTTLVAKALTNEESDAMELSLPVIPFGVKQAVAASGAISETKAERSAQLDFPGSAEVTSRGIDIEISPSVAGAIFGSLEYLTSFPYGCTEQTMSSFLPNVIVASTLKELKVTSSINPNLLKRQVDAGLERLYDFQHEDGGWGWWKEDQSMVFMTAYVVAGMAQAKAAGYQPRYAELNKGKEFLHKSLADHPNMIADLRAYVVYALALAGDKDAKLLNGVWDKSDKLSAEGVAFAGLAMHLIGDNRRDKAVEKLRGMAKNEGDTVYWPSQNDRLLDVDVDNSAETTAYAVKLLTQISPNDPVLPQAVQWMIRHRSDGYYWESTKQTAMVVYGITDYLRVSKELDAAFTADVIVNGKQVLSRSFTAQDTTAGKPSVVHLSSADVANTNSIVLRKNGSGRLYWSARAPYYSNDKSLYNKGGLSLNIARDYYKLTSTREGEKIVYTLGALSGPVQSGDVLAVRVTVSGSSLKYLMVEDPIPGGTEFIERDELYEVKDKPSWWRNWYDRREFHDDRAAIFQTYFDKQREYFYLLKVVNPGAFRISPASVQPMYQPGVLSTTDPATMEVK